MDDKVSELVVRGRIISVTGRPDGSLMVVRGGRIESIDDLDDARDAEGRGAASLDFQGRAIVPGFVDPHVHLELLAAAEARAVDCRYPSCKTIDDVISRLKGALHSVAPGGWLLAYGNLFFDQKLADRRLPSRVELDSVSLDVPIQIACGGHTSVLNSRALELAGVDRFLNGAAGLWGSPVVQIGDDGRPTGVVSEIDQLLPIPPIDSTLLMAQLAETYAAEFLRHGVTTVGEMLDNEASAGRYQDLVASGRFAGRVAMYALVPSAFPLREAIDWVADYESAVGVDRVRANGIKLFADGGYSARNAATRTPYVAEHAPHSGYCGRLNLTRSEIAEAIAAARLRHVQVAIHANGPRAQDEVVGAILDLGEPHKYPPTRVEHAGNLVNERRDLEQFRKANCSLVLQPGFLHNFMADFVPMILGDAGTRGRLPLRSILDDGMRPAASSDVGPGAELEQSRPMFSIWECMARRSYWDLHIEPAEAISFAEALRIHTIEGARVLGMDGIVGSLDPGKAADFVVLDGDPRDVPMSAIRTMNVHSVFVDGVCVLPPDGVAHEG
ncbi:MAG: amidohydrolase family protein [Actinomycetota bacterium]|nr:amidohydrolase family protein [Actinomycetota bacterium]